MPDGQIVAFHRVGIVCAIELDGRDAERCPGVLEHFLVVGHVESGFGRLVEADHVRGIERIGLVQVLVEIEEVDVVQVAAHVSPGFEASFFSCAAEILAHVEVAAVGGDGVACACAGRDGSTGCGDANRGRFPICVTGRRGRADKGEMQAVWSSVVVYGVIRAWTANLDRVVPETNE